MGLLIIVGKAVVLSNVVVFIYIVVVEACAHVVPFMKNNLDIRDPQYLGSKLMVLVIGIIVYILLIRSQWYLLRHWTYKRKDADIDILLFERFRAPIETYY